MFLYIIILINLKMGRKKNKTKQASVVPEQIQANNEATAKTTQSGGGGGEVFSSPEDTEISTKVEN